MVKIDERDEYETMLGTRFDLLNSAQGILACCDIKFDIHD